MSVRVLRDHASPGPQAVGRLEREQPGAPALGRDPRPLGGDDVRRLVGQVAHDLPADRGIGVEQPVDDGHGSIMPWIRRKAVENPVVLRWLVDANLTQHRVDRSRKGVHAMVTQRTTSTAQHVPIDTDSPEVRLGKAFVMAVVDGDFRRLASLLAADVRFRALVPRAFHEVDSADAARAIFEGWFGETEERELLDSSSELVADRLLVAYRLRFREAGRPLVAEQQLVAIVSDGRLRDVALLCSGFRPVGGDLDGLISGSGHGHTPDAHLDGIGLSCATLTPSIRAALMAIEPGQVLEITTDDPTAHQGLQSWTRLTGHELLARTPSSDDSDGFYVRRSPNPQPRQHSEDPHDDHHPDQCDSWSRRTGAGDPSVRRRERGGDG